MGRKKPGSYIMHTVYGSYCTVCQSPLGCEEIDWDECDACGGEGIWPQEEDMEEDEIDDVSLPEGGRS